MPGTNTMPNYRGSCWQLVIIALAILLTHTMVATAQNPGLDIDALQTFKVSCGGAEQCKADLCWDLIRTCPKPQDQDVVCEYTIKST